MSDQKQREDENGTAIPQIVTKPEKTLKFKCTFSGTVCDAMRRRGWVEVYSAPNLKTIKANQEKSYSSVHRIES